MTLPELVGSISGFSGWSHAAKIKLFAWYLHTQLSKETFTGVDIKNSYDELCIQPPTSIPPFLNAMVERKPKEALKRSKGYVLERAVRSDFDSRYGLRPATAQLHKLLSELPSQVSNPIERTFLDETIICFKYGANRAAIVMTWNLAFDHLCKWVLKEHLAAFNAQLPKSFPRARITSVTSRDDFTELKESEVLQICRSSGIITDNLNKILKEKLDRRNMAAHPSGVDISPLTTEDFITDLLQNVVLRLA
jgi:hypothetical protein